MFVERRGEGEELEIRLKPLEEYRALVEERGKFMLFQAEEVTDNAEGKPVPGLLASGEATSVSGTP